MKKIKLIISIFLIFSVKISISQSLDTATIIKNLKFKLYSDANLHLLRSTTDNIFLTKNLAAKSLPSNGFADFLFFKIDINELAIDSVKEKITNVSYSPLIITNGDHFIYAYHKIKKQFYALKGIRRSEFGIFYNELKQWQNWKPLSQMDSVTINSFTQNFSVTGVDFNCLLQSFTTKGSCMNYYVPERKAQ